MKVLVLVPDLKAVGGVSTFFKSIQDYFVDHQVVYFTRGTRADVRKIWQIFIKLFDYLKFFWELLIHQYDLVHVNTSLGKSNLFRDPWFVFISKLFGKKVLLFYHGWKTDSISLVTRPLMNMFFRSDATIVLATEFKNNLRDWGYSNPIYVINTVVAKEMEQLLENHTPRRTSDEITILFLSRIEVAKGIYEAIQAFDLIQKISDKKVKLVIAGSGSEMDNVKQYIARHQISNVHICGYVSGAHKAEVLLGADIYLFPSHEEGMPISVLEAMMAGLPVITRSIGGLVDFFDNNKMGRITDSKDPGVFADMLIDLISHPSSITEISAFNYNYAKENFTVDRFINRLETIYAKV